MIRLAVASRKFIGEGQLGSGRGETRTPNPRIMIPLLCRLSYPARSCSGTLTYLRSLSSSISSSDASGVSWNRYRISPSRIMP